MQIRDKLFIGIIILACGVGLYLSNSSADKQSDELVDKSSVIATKSEGVDGSVTDVSIVEASASGVPAANTQSAPPISVLLPPTIPTPSVNDWGETQFDAAAVPEKMTVQEKKERFKSLLGPAVDQVYAELHKRYWEIKWALENSVDDERITALKVEYKAETDQELLAALKPHPRSIVLAQAAMESAWGTSRFFIKANNIFGVWSFDKDEPRIAAGEQRGEKTIWLKKYDSIYASVKDNYRVLGRSHAFQDFRWLRLETDNPYELVKKLDRYSEKGAEYTDQLISMISFNKFAEYDDVFYERN